MQTNVKRNFTFFVISIIAPITAVRIDYSPSKATTFRTITRKDSCHSLYIHSFCALSPIPSFNHHRSSKMVSGMVVLVVAAFRALSSNYLDHRCFRDRDQSGQYPGNHGERSISASRSDTFALRPRIFQALDKQCFAKDGFAPFRLKATAHLSAHRIEAVDHGRDI